MSDYEQIKALLETHAHYINQEISAIKADIKEIKEEHYRIGMKSGGITGGIISIIVGVCVGLWEYISKKS